MSTEQDPRVVGIDGHGHPMVPAHSLAVGEWAIGSFNDGTEVTAGRVEVIDPDWTERDEPSCWPLLRTADGWFAYDWIGTEEPVAICTHNPRCEPANEETPCT